MGLFIILPHTQIDSLYNRHRKYEETGESAKTVGIARFLSLRILLQAQKQGQISS